MKVIVAHNRYVSAQPSGENAIVDAEIAQLREAGVTVLPLLRSSDEIAEMGTLAKATLALSPVYAPAAAAALRQLIREHRPDVLHLHNPYPLLSPWLIRTAQAHNVATVATVHNYRQVCANAVYFRDGHLCHDCRDRAFAWPAVAHRCYRGSRTQSLVMATTLAVHRPTWRAVDHYVALTDALAAHLDGYGIPRERITVKPNAIADPGAGPDQGEGFLYAARLTPEKGLPLLLDAWSRHPDGSLGPLWIMGDGPLRDQAVAAAATRGDIHYLGALSGVDKWAAFRRASVVIACPTWDDVLPTVVIEALASARPVLGTALGGLPYLIGQAGWTVSAEAAALAGALPTARDGADALRSRARDRYLDTFTPTRVTQRLIGIYESAIRSRSGTQDPGS